MKIAIIGAGGINSWLIDKIFFAQRTSQINNDIQFHVYDGDQVEQKNISYQNFKSLDILTNKATALAERYMLIDHPEFVEKESTLDEYDIVICGVDNRIFRAMLFNYMERHPEKYWIDLRAEGRFVAYYTKHKKNTLDILMATLPAEGSGATSCQLEYERSAGIIQYGNQIIATIGVQLLLNHLRGELNPPDFVQRF